MILKGRTESDELLTLRSLNTRMNLTEKDKYYYSNLEKGYEGELKFDQLTENLQEECYIINDLLLEVNKSFFQIDSLIISQAMINLIDVKNFQGDYYLELDNLYSASNQREYKNPIVQLNRSASLFRQLLQNFKYNYIVDPSIIFINPDFTLYQAPMNLPIVLPTQVNRFITNLSGKSSKLNADHMKLAQKLISLHQPKNPYNTLPKYDFAQLRKGILCPKCFLFLNLIDGKTCSCNNCGHKEPFSTAILRSINEHKLLFPDQKVTTNIIYEWCNVASKEKIGKTLRKNFKIVGVHQWAYYE